MMLWESSEEEGGSPGCGETGTGCSEASGWSALLSRRPPQVVGTVRSCLPSGWSGGWDCVNTG